MWQANDMRENYIKRNFLAGYQAAEAAGGGRQKVFLKYGANHLFAGRSPTDVLSLGNFVINYAAMRGLGTFSIHVDCWGGNSSNPQTGSELPCNSYFLGEDAGLAKFVFAERPTLINLKALRPHRRLLNATLDDNSLELIWSFDAYLAFPNVTAATPVSLE